MTTRMRYYHDNSGYERMASLHKLCRRASHPLIARVI